MLNRLKATWTDARENGDAELWSVQFSKARDLAVWLSPASWGLGIARSVDINRYTRNPQRLRSWFLNLGPATVVFSTTRDLHATQ